MNVSYCPNPNRHRARRTLTQRRAEVLVRVQRLVTPLVLDVPHADRLVVAGADHVLAARMEHDAAHPVVVAAQREQAHAHRDVPDLRT